MPRPGFYNDNEYRAYPFVFQPEQAAAVPYSAVVDAGVVMGIDSEFNSLIHAVRLAAVRRLGDLFEFELQTDAPGAENYPLIFTRDVNADEWLTEYVESAAHVADVNSCAEEPAWTGFLVTGPLTDLRALLPTDGEIVLSDKYILEPGRIQSLLKSYLRAITVGNLSRPRALSSCDVSEEPPRQIIINKRCIRGPIRFKEGYNAVIRQREAINELAISAGLGAGAPYDDELCENGSELPFYPDEQKPILTPATDTTPEVRSKFFSGGPACDEVIATINGVGGPHVAIAAGSGIRIVTDPNTNSITLELSSTSLTGNC